MISRSRESFLSCLSSPGVRSLLSCAPSERPPVTGEGGCLIYACADRCVSTHAYLSLEPLDLSVLVLQLCAKLIGRHLFSLHDLDQVDVLLHQDLTLNDDVRVARKGRSKDTGGFRRVRLHICRFVFVRPLAFLS